MTTQPGEDQKMFVLNNHEKMMTIKYTVIPGIKTESDTHKERAVNIISHVCDAYNIIPIQIFSKSRKRITVLPKQIAMFLMNVYAHFTLKQIGEIFHQDHTTVIHSRETVRDLISTQPDLKAMVSHLRSQCGL